MQFQSITKIGSLAILLSISMSVLADNPPVACPSVALVQSASQKLDTVSPSDEPGAYTVSTLAPAFNDSDKAWFIGVSPIIAKDSNDALMLAKINVQATRTQETDNAFPVGKFYACMYSSGERPVIMALANIDNSGTRPSVNNFSSLH